MAKQSFRVSNICTEFVPENTFFIGQVFNWMKTDSGVFCGTMGDKLLEIQVIKYDIH